MDIGIGLPNAASRASGPDMLEWARRAERLGFSTLATVDRINFATFDSLTLLAAVAGATERIGLLTNVLLAPAYDPIHLAKRAGTLALLAPGRLRLGLGIGTREDDYVASGQEFSDRGRRFDEMLETLRRGWHGDDLVPGVGGKVGVVPSAVEIPLLIGGQPRFAAPRALRMGAGWTIGGGGPDLAAKGISRFREAWAEAGGGDLPRITALEYFSLGDGNADESRATLRAYYGHLTEFVEGIVEGAPRTPNAVADRAAAYAAIGIDELILVGTAADPSQVDALAGFVFG